MRTATLGDVARIVSGATPKTGVREFWDGPIPWVTPADLSKLDGAYISRTPRNLTESGVRSCATTVLPANSVLLSSRAPIGHVAINTIPMATNQGFKSLVPGPLLNSKFLYHWLRSKTLYLQSLGNGATFKEISKRTTEQIEIPLPPLDEQRRIAAILDHADALRAKHCQVLDRLDGLAQSTFIEMFSESPSVPLGQLLTFITSGGRGWAKYYASEGEPFIRSLDVQMNHVTDHDIALVDAPNNAEARRTRTQSGDVLLTITGSRIGRAAPVPGPLSGGYVSQHVAILRPDPKALLPDFLSAFLCAPTLGQLQIANAQYGQTKPGLNFEQIKDFRLPLAQVPLQREFQNRLTNIRRLRVLAVAESAEANALFASLQSRAFRGDL